MAVTVEVFKREFIYQKDGKDISLLDPGNEFTPHKIRDFYTSEYPELLTGSIEGPKYEEDKAIYILKANAGTKG